VLIDLQARCRMPTRRLPDHRRLRAQLIGSEASSKFTEPDKLLAGFRQVMAKARHWTMS